MQDSSAAQLADEYIKLILQYQHNLFSVNSASIHTPEGAAKIAHSLAVFRSELVEEFKLQASHQA